MRSPYFVRAEGGHVKFVMRDRGWDWVPLSGEALEACMILDAGAGSDDVEEFEIPGFGKRLRDPSGLPVFGYSFIVPLKDTP